MTKLVLEEGGKRREFRLGAGLLTVGSGEGARLRLESSQVADVHLEIDIREDGVTVRPRPGVLPPKVSGMPKTEPFEVEPGRPITVGDVRFWVEREEDAGAGPAVRKSSARKVQRRQARKRGAPTWLIISGTLVVVVVAFLFVKKAFEGQAELGAGSVLATLNAVEEHVEHGNLEIAERKLDGIPAAQALGEADAARVARLRTAIEEARGELALDSENLRGTKWFERMLERYEKKWLGGNPQPHKVRLFLERAEEFKQRWPKHPRMEWLLRHERRFEGAVDLDAPLTDDDVDWQLKYLIDQETRNYAAALELIETYMRTATEGELVEASDLRDEILAGRPEYHRARMEQAREEYEVKEDAAKAVWCLVHLVLWIDEDEMAQEAADTLVRIPDLDAHLRGYRREYPERFDALLEHPTIRAYARDKDLNP